MKLALTILCTFISFNSIASDLADNSKGTVERTEVIKFSPRQIGKIKSLIYSSKGGLKSENFPKAYKFIYSILQKKDTDAGTLFWFNKATSINKDVGSSSYMIRTYTTIGLQLADRDVGDLQKISDNIAENVLTDVIRAGGVLPLQNILAKDITAAMKVGNIQDLAGWGGSFYYWKMPLVDSHGAMIKDPETNEEDDYLTVGDSILRDPDQKRRFIMTCVLSMAYTPYALALSDAPGLVKAVEAIKQLPDTVKLPIIDGIAEIDPVMGGFLKLVD